MKPATASRWNSSHVYELLLSLVQARNWNGGEPPGPDD